MMKLYAHPDNYKTKKALTKISLTRSEALIAAEYVGLEVSCPLNAGEALTGKAGFISLCSLIIPTGLWFH